MTENWHVDGVLSASLAPATVDTALAETAVGHARRLAEGYAGIPALKVTMPDTTIVWVRVAVEHSKGYTDFLAGDRPVAVCDPLDEGTAAFVRRFPSAGAGIVLPPGAVGTMTVMARAGYLSCA